MPNTKFYILSGRFEKISKLRAEIDKLQAELAVEVDAIEAQIREDFLAKRRADFKSEFDVYSNLEYISEENEKRLKGLPYD